MKINLPMLKDIMDNVTPPPPLSETLSGPATVFLLLTFDADTSILAIQKTDTEGYFWRNQIALPGGHIDGKDKSAAAAAFRELEEELNITADQVEFLGSLGCFPTRISRKNVEVFVGFWKETAPVTFDTKEISRYFRIPVAELYKTHVENGYHNHLPPVDDLNYFYDNTLIWGLTARIIHYFLEILFPYYCHGAKRICVDS